MNRFKYIARETREKRDNDHGYDCAYFERGVKIPTADCDTDGHYMCDYCKFNAHQSRGYYTLALKTGLFT